MSESMTCVMCGAEITGSFYRVGPQEICPICRDRVTGDAFVKSGTATGELRGLIGAALGAVLGAATYAVALVLFSWWGGFAAIVVGLTVGGGLSLGSRGRTATADRLVALSITYAAIVVAQVPMLVTMTRGAGVPVIALLLWEGLVDSFLLPVTAVRNLGGTGLVFGLFIALALAASWASSGHQSMPGGITGPYRLR